MLQPNLPIRLIGLLAGLILVLGSQSFAQDSDSDAKNVAASSLEIARQISAESGRPIFAVAGRST